MTTEASADLVEPRFIETDFIEVFENALSPQTCSALIDRYETSTRIRRGAMGGGIDTSMKNSWDLTITGDAQWADAEGALNGAMLQCLFGYLRKYPYTILAPVWLRMRDPQSGMQTLLEPDSLIALDDERLRALIMRAFRPGGINIQKYIADEGGYPRWHCELFPESIGAESLHRTLLWTLYLNDDFDAGETEFYHQQRKIKPKTGSLLLAPAGFTHTHRGNVPKRGNKYIATSWLLFHRGETLYGQK